MTTPHLKPLWVILLALTSFGVSAQTISVGYTHHITTDDGLAQSNVNAILLDSEGFVWLGTDDGLNRFDSHNLKTHKYDRHDSMSLSENQVISLFEDSQGRLWVGTAHGGGINLYDKSNVSFKKLPNEASPAQKTALCIAEDQSGNIWQGTHDGLLILKPGSQIFEPIAKTMNRNIHVLTIAIESDGTIWIGTDQGLMSYSPATDKLSSYTDAFEQRMRNNTIRTMIIDHKNQLWIGTLNGLYRLNIDDRSFNSYYQEDGDGLSSNIIISLFQGHGGEIWIGTDGAGVIIYENETFEQLKDPFNELNNLSVKSIAQYDDNIFIGTLRKGLKIIRIDNGMFGHRKNLHPIVTATGKNTILDFVEDSFGFIWIGTDGAGLYRYEPKTEQFLSLEELGFKTSLSSDVVKSLLIDNRGNMLAGTYAGGLNYLYNATKEIQVFKHDPKDAASISNDNVWALYQDSRGTIWAATLSGLNIFDPNTGRFRRFDSSIEDSTSIVSSVVFQIREDKKGRLWFSTPDGLSEYLPHYDQFRSYIPNKDVPSRNYLRDFIIDENDNLWITSKYFIYQFDGTNFQEAQFSNQLSGSPKSIILDQNNQFWIGTSNGLNRITSSGEVSVFDIGNGIQDKEFRPGASLLSKNGNIYLGGLNGFNRFDPTKVDKSTSSLDVVFTDFYLFHRKVDPLMFGDINYLDQIHLDHAQNVVSISYSAIEHNYPTRNSYAYKLDDFDDDWNYVDDQNIATYTNLEPGSYTFNAMAMNKNGEWSAPKSIIISISPPFWKTGVFRTFLVILIFLVLFAMYRLRLANIIARKTELEKNVNERTRDLSTEINMRETTEEVLKDTVKKLETAQEQLIHSEKMASIGTFTAGIAHEINNPLNYVFGGIELIKQLLERIDNMSTEELKEGLKEAYSITSDGATRSSKIIKSLMFYSHTGSEGSRDWEKVMFGEMLSSVKSYLSKELKNGIDYTEHIDEVGEISIIPDKFSQIMLNLLSNAVDATNSSEDKRIEVDVCLSNGNLIINIFNTGPSINMDLRHKIFDPFFTTKEPGKGTGLGLWITHMLVEDHQGKINFVNEKNGVKFSISIPQ
ncbi:MAG: GHKL domain-containing protein [Cyclobacteriaceae bacterium]